MDFKNSTPQSHDQNAKLGTRTLQVNFTWRKHTILVSEAEGLPPIYLGKYNPWTMKTIFKTGPSAAKALSSDDSDTDSVNLEAENDDVIGDSKIKVFHIDCNTHIRGRAVRLSAAKKIITRYNYPSLAYASDPLKPAVMTWRCNSKIRCFDHELTDEDGQVVARYNPKYLGVRNWATIELLGPKAWDSLATEEVIITGLSLYLCMVYRASNPVPLIGALVSRPGKDYKVTEKEARAEYERNVASAAGANGMLQPDGSTIDPKDVWDRVNERAEVKDMAAR